MTTWGRGESRDYATTNELFTSGKAAFYAAGSWGSPSPARWTSVSCARPVAKQGDGCFFTDHTDIGMGMIPTQQNKGPP